MMFLQVRIFWSSGHHPGVSTWRACHLTHSWWLSKDGLGVEGLSGSSSPPSGNPISDRNCCTSRSNSGGCPKSLGSSAQGCGWEPVASGVCLPAIVGWGTCFTSVSLLGLESSKVTLLLSLTGLGKAAHLLAGSPVWSSAKGTCSSWPVSRCLLWLLVHLLLLEHCQLPNWPWLPECPWVTEQPSLSMWPSNRATATSTWWWTSQATLRASLHDSCSCPKSGQSVHRSPASSHGIWPVQAFWCPYTFTSAPPLDGLDPTYARDAPSVSQGSPGGSSPPPLGLLVWLQGPSSIDRPPGIGWRSLLWGSYNPPGQQWGLHACVPLGHRLLLSSLP